MVIHRRIKRVLLENITQYTGSIVLIILSCFMFSGMTLVGANLQRLNDAFRNRNVQEDASFTTDKPIGNLQEIESETDAVIEAGETFDYALSAATPLRIFSQNERVNTAAVVEGNELRENGDILLNPVFAAAKGFKIGDRLTILDKSFIVAGFMALPNYIYPLHSETDLMYSPQSFGIAVITKGDFAAFDRGKSIYAVRFHRTDPHPRARATQFRALLLSKGIRIEQWTDIGDNKRVSSADLKIEAITMMSRVMPGALLLLTSILICAVIARLIGRESAIIGALYALGYQRKEIYRHYLIFPLTIAVIGGIIGSLLGLLIVRPMLLFMLTSFDIPLTGIDYNPFLLLVSLLLPILFLGCSSYFVIQKELKRSPVELMKGERGKNQVNFLESGLKLDRLNFVTKFQIREQLRSLSRLVFLLAGTIAATMLLLYGFTIKSSLDYFITTNLTGTYHFQNEYIFNSLHNEPPPTGAEPFSAALFLPEGEDQREFFVSGVTPDSGSLSFVDESGVPLRTNQTIITKPLADRLKVKPGDSVNIIRKLDGRAFSVKIDRIADTYVGKYIFMPLAAYNENFELPEGSYLGLWSTAPLDIPQNQLSSQKSIDESVAAIKETTVPVQYMIVMYSTIAFIIGIIVIYLVTSMIIEENKSSISLLKIFGYRKKEVNGLILNSSSIVVVIGYAIGVPLILATIGGLLQSLDNSVGLTLPVRINPLFIVVGFIVVMLSFELSKLMCRKKVDAVPMSKALKSGLE